MLLDMIDNYGSSYEKLGSLIALVLHRVITIDVVVSVGIIVEDDTYVVMMITSKRYQFTQTLHFFSIIFPIIDFLLLGRMKKAPFETNVFFAFFATISNIPHNHPLFVNNKNNKRTR